MDWSFVAVGPVEADVDMPAGQIEVQLAGEAEVQVTPASRLRGRVHRVTETGGEAEVHVTLEPFAGGSRSTEEAIEASTVSLDDGSLRVHVPARRFKNVELRCTVVVPAGSSLSVKTASAEVDCPGRLASFSGSVASADITLGSVESDLVLKSASGDLRCESVGGRLSVKAASSDVTVHSASGPVDVALASGDVSIDEAAGSVQVNTASGDLRIGRLGQGELTARSASGDMRIGVAEGMNAYLDLSSLSGEVLCTLPADEEPPAESQLRISCHTMSGDVRVESATARAGRVGHD